MTPIMTHHCYLFEAKSIQSYIVDTGRLKELIGGSELIDSLCPDLVTELLDQLGIAEGEEIEFSRNAGGAFYAFSRDTDKLKQFTIAWTLLLRQYAPGLDFAQAQASADNYYDAYRAASKKMIGARNRATVALPQPGPCTLFSPRSGRPAVPSGRLAKDELIDRQTRIKLQREKSAKAKLNQKFIPLSEAEEGDWPNSLNPGAGSSSGERPFPFIGERRQIAIVHADGNGLGQLLIKMGDAASAHPAEFLTLFRDLSNAITTATTDAAARASKEILLPAKKHNHLIAARPIVLGGDDLTLIVRADLALSFTTAFLRHFELCTADQLTSLGTRHPQLKGLLPERLTACAGIAYTHASYPFQLGMHLAEELCGYSKKIAKANSDAITPSALALHRVTSAQSGSWEEIHKRELGDGVDGGYRYTLGAYGLDEKSHLPDLNTLLELTRLLSHEEMARGPTRQLLTLLDKESADAERLHARWRERLKKDRAKNVYLSQFDNCLDALGKSLATSRHPHLPYLRQVDDSYATPLGDALTLMSIADDTITQEQPNREVA